MQKKIIALAIAAAISAPAFADTSNVTVYGVADVSYDSIKTGTPTAVGAAAGVTSNRVSSNTSRLGLKGSEDLGDGLSAIWQIESLINIGDNSATAGTTIGTRNTFAGLSSASAGTVVLGRHDTPYKISTRAYDLFGDGIADNRAIMGGNSYATVNGNGTLTASGAYQPTAAASFDGRQNQVLAYISPKLGGVATLAIGYVNLNPAQNTTASNKATATSVAGMFDIGSGFGAALAYEVHDVTSIAVAPLAAGAKEKATKLGLSYAQDAFAVNFAYEKTSDNFGLAAGSAVGSDTWGHNAYYLSGKYSVTANDTIKAAFTKASTLAMGGTAASANTDAKQFTVGYDHSLSKRTYVYALYTKLSNGSAAGYTLGSGTSSVGGVTTSAGLGASPSAFAFGMRHTF
jgi:predicted porin